MTFRPAKSGQAAKAGGFGQAVLPKMLWGVAIIMVAVTIYVALTRAPVVFSQAPTPVRLVAGAVIVV